jgi:CRP-like cAMP-binding protein
LKPKALLNLNHNKLFSQLTLADQASLQKISHRQELSARQVLGSPQSNERTAYFLTGASVALLAGGGGRPGLALGLVGLEGAVGVQFALGLDPGIFTFLVQTPGTAWSVEGAALESLCRQRPEILLVLSRYLWTMTQEMAVFAAFAQVSDVKPRLARWILTSYSRSHRKELTLTQVHLAEMLGVRRASITLAAVELKAEGLIEYRRGKLLVLDMMGLEAATKPPVQSNA